MLIWLSVRRQVRALRRSGWRVFPHILALTIIAAFSQAKALDCAKPGASADAAACAKALRQKLPPAPADPRAQLSRASVSASADETAFLTVESPGRLSIRANSGSGVALQLIDMMTGPGEIAGERGVRDGRLDVLLDRGVYKLRSFGAKGATGEARLTVAPSHAAAPAQSDLLRGGEASAGLGDVEQRSYWTIVTAGSDASIEAIGRGLRDLRLWRNGSDLVDLTPEAAAVEPQTGHPMTRLRLAGAVQPGLYLVTAYGGVSSAWADGQQGNPFHIRIGPPRMLAGGWFEGAVDTFGSARFEIPPPATYVRLELAEPAPATLSAGRGSAAAAVASISKTSREAFVALTVAAKGNESAFVEVAGLQGQAFRLRALNPSDTLRVDEPGPHLVAVDVAGEGGDEPPATALLARFAKGNGAVVDSKALRIARGEAWRGKFNLRGPSSLIFEVASSGPVALRTQGPGVRATLEPLLGANAPRADGKIPQQWDVEAGWYTLKLEPIRDAAGVIDVTFGQPGLAPAPSPSPARTTIDFGLQNFDKGAYYEIFANSAPGLAIGPYARKLPADLAAAPLVIEQQAQVEDQAKPAVEEAPVPPLPPKRPSPSQRPPPSEKKSAKAASKAEAKPAPVRAAAAPGALVVPLRVPLGGAIAAADVDGKPIDISLSEEAADDKGRTLIVTIPSARRDRRIVITWSKITPPAAVPDVPALADVPILKPGEAQFFDLARDEGRSFRLDVAEGGLYRIETLGRLKTSAAIGTPFTPTVDRAANNGPGHNALLQTFLRAGSYRVAIKAFESEGHLGLVAHRAALNEAGLLAPEQSVRAALTQGAGAIFTIDAPETATYRLDLYALGKDFPARLEELDGWPLTPPGPLATLQRAFEKGRYRLVVPPVDQDARVVARMRTIADASPPQGHGPHPLAFETPQKFQWREPPAGAPREPDRWTFSLQGPAHVSLGVSEGMSGELTQLGSQATIAKIAYQRSFDGVLTPGDYSLEARSIGHNDRLDYEITLNSSEIQPNAPRLVELPASIPFTIGADRIVSLTSFGAIELIGVLKDDTGSVVERLNGRADDWNIALSRHLPAGAYQLELAAAQPEAASAKETDQPEDAAASDEAAPDEQDASAADSDAADQEATPQGDTDHADGSRAKVELHLALPQTLKGPDLDLENSAQVAGQAAHQLALPPISGGALLVVAAQSSSDSVLLLERQDAKGEWRSIGFDRGRAPAVAAPADGDMGRPWRVSVWPIEGDAAITVAARAVEAPDQELGSVALKPIPIEGISPPVEVAAIATGSKSLVVLSGAPAGLRQGSAPGRALSSAADGIVAPQAKRLWFVKRSAVEGRFELEAIPPTLTALALDLAEGDVATLSQPASGAGSLRVWRARSSFGQPGLDAGKGMGVAPTGGAAAAIALNGGEPLRVWNAGDGPLRLNLDAVNLSALPMVNVEAQYASALAPGVAQLVRLPASIKEIEINLAPGAAAFLNGGGHPTTVWGDDKAISRRLTGAWTNILFVNAGADSAPVSLAANPAVDDKPLAAGGIVKRFSGAAGSSSLRVEAKDGDRLVAAGARAAFIADAGAVLKGSSLTLPGSGELILDHDAGLHAVWVENNETSPWPSPEPQKIAPPQIVRLEGQAITLALAPDAPTVLNARSTAPVILALARGDVKGDPVLYPAGAELHAYLPTGQVRLTIYSPHDGALSGALELTTSPLIQAGEGVGEAVALAPGAAALFAFDVPHAETIGVGVRSDPDSAQVRLLDANAKSLGDGVAQLQRLEPGRYLIEARAPTGGPALIVRPAVVGLTPPADGPPPDVAQHYLELVGLKPTRTP